MKYLLDTCIISELIKPKPNLEVVRWISSIKQVHFSLSVLTIGEIQRGIFKLPKQAKRLELERWLQNDLLERFSNRVIDISVDVSLKWGELSALAESKGTRIPVIDGLLACTAIVHDLVFVTRNTDDVKVDGLEVFNPWGS